MENVHSYKVDKTVEDPLDHLDNDLDLNDKEKLWVEKMNQLNTERSREDQTDDDYFKDDSVDSPEFSPIVYWKEPFPEVLPLDIEEEPAKVSGDSALSSCPTPGPGSLTASASTQRSSQQTRALGGCLVSSVWMERSKYEDAELKYYRLQSKGEKSKPTMEETKVRPPPRSDQFFQTSTKLEQEEDDRTFEDYLERFATDNVEIRKTLMSLNDCVMQLQERIKNLEQGNKKLAVNKILFSPLICPIVAFYLVRAPCLRLDLKAKVLTWATPLVSAASMMIVCVIQIFEEKIKSKKCFPVFCSGLELEPSEGSLTSGSSLYSGSEFEEFLPTKG